MTSQNQHSSTIPISLLHRLIRAEIIQGFALTCYESLIETKLNHSSQSCSLDYNESDQSSDNTQDLQTFEQMADKTTCLPYLPSCIVVSLSGELSFNLKGEPYLTLIEHWYHKFFFWRKLSTVKFVYFTSKFNQNYCKHVQALAHLYSKQHSFNKEASPKFDLSCLDSMLELKRVYINSQRVNINKMGRSNP